MICQSYVHALERAFEPLHVNGLLSKQIFCYVLDRALYATRCGTTACFRANNRYSPRYIEPFCRSNKAEERRILEPRIRENLKGLSKEERRKKLSTIAVTKEHVVPESVLWNLFCYGTATHPPKERDQEQRTLPRRTPVNVIAALYNVAFITIDENEYLSPSSMPKDWIPPYALDEITNDVVWARYRQAGLFDEMIRVADYVGDWHAPRGA